MWRGWRLEGAVAAEDERVPNTSELLKLAGRFSLGDAAEPLETRREVELGAVLWDEVTGLAVVVPSDVWQHGGSARLNVLQKLTRHNK